MVSSKKEHPKLNPNKPKKRSVKDLVTKKFDSSSSTGDYSSEFKNVSEDEEKNARPKLKDTEIETIDEPKTEELELKEETKSAIKPFDSMDDVTKNPSSDTDSKTNPTLDDFMETRPKLREDNLELEEPIVDESYDEVIVEVESEDEASEDETSEEEVDEEVNEELKEDVEVESEDNDEESKSSNINPIGSVKDVIKKLEPEHPPSKPTLNPSPNDLKPKDSVNPIKEAIKKTESEVKSASDNTIDSVKEVIKKLDSDSKPTLNPSPNDLPKTRQKTEDEPSEEEIEEKKKEKEEKDKIKREIEEYEDSDEEYDDSEIPKHFKFTSNLFGLKIGLFGHKIKIVDIVIVFIGLFLIFCGGIAALGVAEKVIDNVVFGEKSTISFLLVIVGILFISSVLGPALIKRSSLKGFYEQLQNVDAEPKKDTSSEESDSKDGNKKEENEEESSEEESSEEESSKKESKEE